MTQISKGICEQKKVSLMPNNLRYKSGQKRDDAFCDCYLHTEEITCSCCTAKLWTKPQSKKIWEQ